jgi:hypothetical protein
MVYSKQHLPSYSLYSLLSLFSINNQWNNSEIFNLMRYVCFFRQRIPKRSHSILLFTSLFHFICLIKYLLLFEKDIGKIVDTLFFFLFCFFNSFWSKALEHLFFLQTLFRTFGASDIFFFFRFRFNFVLFFFFIFFE